MRDKYYRTADIKLVCDPYMDHDVHQYTAEEIAQSINAIPIEWLKRYRDTRINKYGPLFEEFGTMLERWEKENEDTCMQLRQR